MFSASALNRTARFTRGRLRTASLPSPWHRFSSELVASMPERILCASLNAGVSC